jgi:hypothetical protein
MVASTRRFRLSFPAILVEDHDFHLNGRAGGDESRRMRQKRHANLSTA